MLVFVSCSPPTGNRTQPQPTLLNRNSASQSNAIKFTTDIAHMSKNDIASPKYAHGELLGLETLAGQTFTAGFPGVHNHKKQCGPHRDSNAGPPADSRATSQSRNHTTRP